MEAGAETAGGGQGIAEIGGQPQIVLYLVDVDHDRITGVVGGSGAFADGLPQFGDDKGAEPEAVTTGFFRGRTYAFIGLERTGGILVYDVSNPRRPFFVQYADNIVADPETGELSAEVGSVLDQGPEGVIFIPQSESPTHRALLVAAHEVSGTVTIYSVLPRPLS